MFGASSRPAGARARVRGEDDRLADPAEAVDDAREPLRWHVGLTVDRRDDVLVRDEPEPRRMPERSRAIGAKRKQTSAITSPTTSMRPGTPSRCERRRRPLVGAEEQLRDSIDGDAVSLLGHREVAAAQAGLDVRDRHVARRLRACERRVRVAVDEHPVRPLARDAVADRRRASPPGRRCGGRAGTRARAARARRRRPPTSPRPSAGPCAATTSSMPAIAQCGRDRPRLDELGPVPDHREDPHASEATMGAASGR